MHFKDNDIPRANVIRWITTCCRVLILVMHQLRGLSENECYINNTGKQVNCSALTFMICLDHDLHVLHPYSLSSTQEAHPSSY